MFCMRSTGLGKRWLRCAKKPSDSMMTSCRYCHSSACLPKIRAGISNLTRHFCPFSSCQDSCCNTTSKTGTPAGRISQRLNLQDTGGKLNQIVQSYSAAATSSAAPFSKFFCFFAAQHWGSFSYSVFCFDGQVTQYGIIERKQFPALQPLQE